MEKFNIFLLFLSILFVCNNVESTKLNYPRVLLPIFDKLSINFTLEVIEKGCFKWISSRQDLIQITPVYEDVENECSSRAIVKVLSKERRRNTAIVLAEDLATGEVLRCDVILDVIHQLGVLTTTRELYLEEAPETFELWAQDSQGNAFTTLEGVEFSWALVFAGQNNKDYLPALRFLSFSESKYHEVPASLAIFENLGIKGYMVLLEGINTGTAKVQVSLPYPEYSDVREIEVYITVLANIILDPSDVHIMVGDTINFRVLQLKQGKLQEISLNSQYYFQIEDESYATISGQQATGRSLGRTSVILRDRNVPDANFNQDGNGIKSPVPRATLTVSTPHKLVLNLLPHYNWLTVEGEKHEIAIDLYTSDDQKILLGTKYTMQSEYDENLYYTHQKTRNGSRIYGEAFKSGSGPVLATFKELSAKAELQVFKELSLSPQRVILPYDPNVIKTQKVQFQAQGGDGNYIWTSHNPHLLSIAQSGVASTRTEIDGDVKRATSSRQTIIRVALAKNTKIYRTAEVHFVPPVKLEIVKYNFETSLKDYVKLHIALYALINGTHVPYTKCDNLNFDFEFTNQIFQVDTKPELKTEVSANGCHLAFLRSTSVGTTQLKVSYKTLDTVLRDDVTLHVFEKLNIINPIENEIILPIGASRNVIYSNGPQKIFTLEAELTKRLSYDKKIAEISAIELDTTKSIYAFTVLCRKIGTTELKFQVFNLLQQKNFEPYNSEFLTTVHCVKPRFLNLYTPIQFRQGCPMQVKNSLMHLKEQKDHFDVEIEVQDAKNRKLMNISSLVIDWEFSQTNGKQKAILADYARSSEVELVEGIEFPGKQLLKTSIGDIVGNLKIKGLVSKYDDGVLKYNSIKPEVPNFGIENPKTGEIVKPKIENEINFMAVNRTMFSFQHISIFLSKNRPQKFSISQGSGFYEFELSENGIVSVDFDPSTQELILTPFRIGHVQVEIIDRCLSTETVKFSVSVVSIGSIEVHIPDLVEISKQIEAIVRLYDSNEELLKIDSNNLEMYELSEDIYNPSILSLRLGSQDGLQLGEVRYTVTGVSLGETKIVFKSGQGENAIHSETANVQVFSPLRLIPRNSTLLVGSTVQISHQGGPQPGVNIVYTVENSNIAGIDSTLVQGKNIGQTRVTGRCYGHNPVDGKQMVISQDSVTINVIPMEKIEIRTPLVRIKSGAVMPATVWGVPDLSPMVLGTLENMRVIWSTNQPDVVDLYNIFSDAGIEYKENDLIAIRVKALNPGKARIQATVVLSTGQRFTSSVDVVVFKILELETPKNIKMDSILMAPHTSIQLKANLDDVVYKSETNNIVKVSSDGMVRSGEVLGREQVIARTFEQTLPIGIEVKNVQYILASLQYSQVKLKQIEQKIPRGMSLVLKISLHDNLGNEFSHNIEDVHGLRHDLLLKDMVDVQIGNNFTISVTFPRETNNMLAVSLKDVTGVKYPEDYIKVSVAKSNHIFPTNAIFAVGDIICFESPLTSSFWLSSDERALSIDRHTGVARVLNNRFKLGEKITVTNGDRLGNSFKYDVVVKEADKIEFSKSVDIFTGSSYKADLIISNSLQMEKSTNLIAKNISKCSYQVDSSPKHFACRLTTKQQQFSTLITDHYKVFPYFDKELGTYSCQIELITSFNDVVHIVKTNYITFELEALLPSGVSDSITLKFIPGIKVTPEALSVDQMSKNGLVISGLDKVLQQVEVKSSDSSLLSTVLQAKNAGGLHYKVKLLKELPSDGQLFIYVHSPLTLQTIEVPILGPNVLLQKCSNQPFTNSPQFLLNILSNVGLIISALIVLAATIWLFLFCYPQRSRADLNSDAFSSPSAKKSPQTPNTSLNQSNSSPRGPLYPNSSPYYAAPQSCSTGIANLSSSNSGDPPVYGDMTLISPQRRINRRYL